LVADNAQVPLFEKFHAACDARHLPTIMELYSAVVASPLLTRDDVRRMTQAVHAHLRTVNPRFEDRSSPRPRPVVALLPFLERIIADIRLGKLPPHPLAHVHLLGIYKESKLYDLGAAFWQWLADQDDRYVDPALYGAAIELLAYQGGHSLADLEALYADALKRFPGTFAEYHLSPEAIVPDRTNQTTIPGVPIALLQGILTARLLNSDWKNAYLALDTALRLYPTSVPQRFFELFMRERPMQEAYTVFLLACRSGVVFKPGYLTSFLGNLANSMFKLDSLADRVQLLRAMANAMYAYLEAGGSLEGPHVGSFFNALRDLLPLQPDAHGEQDRTENDIGIRNAIVTSAHEMTSRLIQAGMPAHPQFFTSLVKVAARFKVHGLLSVTLQDMETARVEVGDIGRRIILQAAGDLGDRELIESRWTELVERAEKEGSTISSNDWITFARTCRNAGCTDLFRQQLGTLKHSIDAATETKAVKELEAPKFQPKPFAYKSLEFPEFVAELEEVKRIVQNITIVVMSGQPLDLRKTPFTMFLNPNKELLGSMEHYRAVYDELTTDPHQPAPTAEGMQAVSPTGIPLADLRFLNWVTIAELMNEADENNELLQQRVDEAIAAGTALNAPASNIDMRGFVRPKIPLVELRDKIRSLRAPRSSERPQASPKSEQPHIPAFKRVRLPDTVLPVQTQPAEPEASTRAFVSGGTVNFSAENKVDLPEPFKHWYPTPRMSEKPVIDGVVGPEPKGSHRPLISETWQSMSFTDAGKPKPQWPRRPFSKDELTQKELDAMIEEHLARTQEDESTTVPPGEEKEKEQE
jgi:hypothetical protein